MVLVSLLFSVSEKEQYLLQKYKRSYFRFSKQKEAERRTNTYQKIWQIYDYRTRRKKRKREKIYGAVLITFYFIHKKSFEKEINLEYN